MGNKDNNTITPFPKGRELELWRFKKYSVSLIHEPNKIEQDKYWIEYSTAEVTGDKHDNEDSILDKKRNPSVLHKATTEQGFIHKLIFPSIKYP